MFKNTLISFVYSFPVAWNRMSEFHQLNYSHNPKAYSSNFELQQHGSAHLILQTFTVTLIPFCFFFISFFFYGIGRLQITKQTQKQEQSVEFSYQLVDRYHPNNYLVQRQQLKPSLLFLSNLLLLEATTT